MSEDCRVFFVSFETETIKILWEIGDKNVWLTGGFEGARM